MRLKLCLFALTFLVLPATAAAHVEIEPVKAPAAKPVTLRLVVGHGCDGAATNRLIALMPQGAVTASRPLPIKGWKARTSGNRIIWSGGPLADHDEGEFPFKATLAGEKGETLPFKVIQRCVGGAETAWIQAGGGGDELEHPAPMVRLTTSGDVLDAADDSEQAEPAPAESETTASAENTEKDESGSSPLRILGLILIVAALTAFVVRLRGRRQGRSAGRSPTVSAAGAAARRDADHGPPTGCGSTPSPKPGACRGPG